MPPTIERPRAELALVLLVALAPALPARPIHAQDPAPRAVGDSTPARSPDVSSGAGVVVLDSAALAGAPFRTFSELLAARAPGVSVLRPSGTLGTGARVRFRGSGGAIGGDEPLLIIDGIRASGEQASLGVSMGGAAPSRLDDIVPEDVERVELLMGPAAAWRYGSEGANGAIVVTTKRGRTGPTRWGLSAAQGVASDATAYPANYGTPGTNILDGSPTDCPPSDAASGYCTPGALRSWNPLERVSPFERGMRYHVGGEVSGGVAGGAIRASAGWQREAGVLPENEARRASARASLTRRFGDDLDVALRAGYLDGRTLLPPEGASYGAVLSAGLLGESVDDPETRGYRVLRFADGSVVPADSTPLTQRISRLTAGLTADWRARSWLRAGVVLGLDEASRHELHHMEQDLPMFPDGSPSHVTIHETADGRDRRITIGTSATASYSLAPALAATTLVGVEHDRAYLRDAIRGTYTRDDMFSSSETVAYLAAKTTGVLVQQRLAWQGRRFLAAGVRMDATESLGHELYPSADASWTLSAEPFFHRVPRLELLRLRAAYGAAGDLQSLLSAMRSFAFIVLPPDAEPIHPRVPRTAEVEGGVDAVLFGGRLTTGLTWFRATTTDALAIVAYAGPSGYGRSLIDDVSWRSSGVEAQVAARPIDRGGTRWDVSLGIAAGHVSLRRYQAPPSCAQMYYTAVCSRSEVGHAPDELWGVPYTFADANGDGVIVPTEITVATDDAGNPVQRSLGRSAPTRTVYLVNTVRLLGRLTLGARLDYHGGHRKLDATEYSRCTWEICRGRQDRGASLAEQAAALVARGAAIGGSGFYNGTGFVQDGSFARLRELSLSMDMPPAWSRPIGAAGATLSLYARNVATWTDYRGLDPEVGTPMSSGSMPEYFSQPLPREFALRLGVRW
ncbi:MAG TPA: TonB-dependent receptor [Gemmatimonadaceae bacterium]|nr:TonB-dependent receptor [Gemmatimonadaceae bacterium]